MSDSYFNAALGSCYTAARKLLVELEEATGEESIGEETRHDLSVLAIDTDDIASRISNLRNP